MKSGEHDGVVDEPQREAGEQLRQPAARRAPAARPIIGAVMAWVIGALIRAGPMTATVWSIAASAAP